MGIKHLKKIRDFVRENKETDFSAQELRDRFILGHKAVHQVLNYLTKYEKVLVCKDIGNGKIRQRLRWSWKK